jgi:hypothetical protein
VGEKEEKKRREPMPSLAALHAEPLPRKLPVDTGNQSVGRRKARKAHRLVLGEDRN